MPTVRQQTSSQKEAVSISQILIRVGIGPFARFSECSDFSQITLS